MKSLAVSNQEKILNLEKFFNTINVRNDQLIKIKESMIQLLQELVKDKIIHNQLEIVFKSDKKFSKIIFIKNLNLEVYTMKAFFRKLARVKTHKAIKRSIAGGLAAWTLKYGRINQTTDLFINSSQEIQSINNQTTYTGAVSEIQNQHNKLPEALKYTIETRGGENE